MATYVNDLRLKEITTGDEAGTWGTSTNTNLELIGEALGYGTQNCFSSNANATTTVADGATDPARAMYFKVTSSATLTATRILTIAPNTISRVMLIENATTGGQAISISQGTGSNVIIPNGQTKMVYLDGAGSGAAVVDATKYLTVGRLSINSSLPILSLDDNSTTNSYFSAYHDGGDTTLYSRFGSNYGEFKFQVDNGTTSINQLAITSVGVGIGTSSPSNLLTVNSTDGAGIKVYGADQAHSRIAIDNLNGQEWNLVAGIAGLSNSGFGIYDADAAATRLQIDSSGNVGIGTTSPARPLEVNGAIRIANASGIEWGGSNYSIVGDTGGALIFNTAGSEAARFDGSGNLLVGTTSSPKNWNNSLIKMRVENGIQFGTYSAIAEDLFDADSLGIVSDASENICFGGYDPATTTYTEHMRIDSSGDVGIGTNDADSRLKVELKPAATVLAGFRVGYNGTSVNYLDGDTNIFRSGNGASERMRIDSSGNVGIGSNSPGFVTGSGLEIQRITATATVRLEYTGSNAFELSAEQNTVTYNSVSSKPHVFEIGSSEKMRIDGSGNVGLGVTPSAWASGQVVFQNTGGALSSGATNELYLGQNIYYGGSPLADRYVVSAAASSFGQTNGSFTWRIAASGTAGNAISFTQAMTLDSSGNLLVGRTSVGTTGTGHSIRGGDSVVFARENGEVMIVSRNSSDGEIVRFDGNGTAGVGSIGTVNGDLFVGTGDTGLRFHDGDNRIYPINTSGGTKVDNAIDLGDPTGRFDDIYATNGTIQTSDANEKQDIEELSEAERRVAVAAKGLLRKFRWISSVEEKGDDARIHFGIIAQDLQAAFEAEGLDAGRYAMFIHSTWTDEETGEERSRMGVRYSELLAFIIAAI